MDERRIVVVGLGYVGLPLAVALSKHFSVTGLDINPKRIEGLKNNNDSSGEVPVEKLKDCSVNFTTNPEIIKDNNFIIVCVPTPINEDNEPDLSFIESSSRLVGENLSPNSIVVYESTVYPGVTEDVCVPIIEKYSSLSYGKDFTVGYSPERMNPGDKERTVDKITKVVSGSDQQTLDAVEEVYGKITKTFRAKNIKVAEAAKVIENIQRDLNIALMNELAVLFDKMNINVHDVIKAASTKWNFHSYNPGLVGGHCIGVDPYYLTYKARVVGYHPEVILAGRKTNDAMHIFYAQKILSLLKKDVEKPNPRILILGLTFKPNVSDYRNSRVKHLINELTRHGAIVSAYDPFLDENIVTERFKTSFYSENSTSDNLDGVVVAVEHDSLKEKIVFLQDKCPIIRLKDL
ncbi:MAG: nucleotide sugar dehydrogenase [archaeon]|nr:nucleotide sugar dehydrogenase [archaeon]